MKPAEEVIGAVGLTVMTVRAGDTSVAMGIGDLPIVSQSQLMSLMEHAAIISIDEHLEPEETTIPISFEMITLSPFLSPGCKAKGGRATMPRLGLFFRQCLRWVSWVFPPYLGAKACIWT